MTGRGWAQFEAFLSSPGQLFPCHGSAKCWPGAARGDLSQVPTADLPSEIGPVGATLNGILDRLHAAFDAKRSFAVNATHERRTPLAETIAQAQRLQTVTKDADAARRATKSIQTLRGLTRPPEKMLQLARAERARFRLDHATDLSKVARSMTGSAAHWTDPSA